jgi:hypothetical protein
MRREIFVLLASALFFFASGCEKGTDRLDDYLVEFATVLKENTSYRFRLDNGRILIPEEAGNFTGNDGQRVILNYVPLKGDNIKINTISPIFTGEIQPDGFPEKYENDPVKIQSVWIGGDYLNMIVEIEYHSTAHRVALLRDPLSPTTDVYFSHSRNNDPPGYPQTMYASFSLHSLRTQANGSAVPFRLFINTRTGMREFQMILQ